MIKKLEQQVGLWLRKLHITVSSEYLRERLCSHPDYPSLSSITDTLDELGIDNAALVIDKERLNEIPVPFLAHNSISEFVIINNAQKQIKENPDFEKNWNGTALLAEKPDNWHHPENTERIDKEKKRQQTVLLVLLSVITLAGVSLINNFSWQLSALLLVTLTGVIVAVLIIQHELGISNEITEQLCTTGKNTDCDAVMNSRGSNAGKRVNWADAGIIYFVSYLLLLVTSIYNVPTNGIFALTILSVSTVPFTLFSLFYQWQVVKKWCPLCLLTIAVLWLQFALLFPVILSLTKGGWGYISSGLILFNAFIISVIAVTWLLLIKPLLEKDKELKDKTFRLLRFKNNPGVFSSILNQQRKADATPFENDLQLGNPQAPLQLIVACNLYCGPCAQAHKVLHELIRNQDIGLTIRLAVKTDIKEDKRTIASAYILQLLNNKEASFKRKVMQDWYTEMNLENFAVKYPLNETADVEDQLREHELWNKEEKIAFTPTVFINGYELPKQYKVTDLKAILPRLETDEIKNNNKYAVV